MVVVDGKGVGGEKVVDMARRLRLILQADTFVTQGSKEMEPYHYVCILGGVNDFLHSGASGEFVFSQLEIMFAEVHQHGARLVAITLPELDTSPTSSLAEALTAAYKLGAVTLAPKPLDWIDEERRKVNDLMIHFVTRHRDLNPSHPPLLVDLAASIGTYSNSSGLYSSDGLHLSPSGYDRLSDAVFKVLKGEIMKHFLLGYN